MIVDKKGRMFENRRKNENDRRKEQVEVKKNRRKNARRVEENKIKRK